MKVNPENTIKDLKFAYFNQQLIDMFFNEEGKKDIERYVEERVKEARIDELNRLVFDMDNIGRLTNYAKIKQHVNARIAELTQKGDK